MDTFLIDDGRVYSDENLLSFLNNNSSYFPLYKTECIYSLLANLVMALANNKPLVLLDSDLNWSELEDRVDKALVNVSLPLCPSVFHSMDDVISAIQRSQSEITIFTSGTTGQPKKVTHTIPSFIRSVRLGDKYENQIWAFAYNPTHMAGLQVFFQVFMNKNTLVNIFGKSRNEVFAFVDKYQITHISATPTFYRLLLPFEREYNSVVRVTFGGEKSNERLYDSIKKIFPFAKLNNVYASTEAGSLFAAKGDCFQIPRELYNKFKIENDELLIHKSLLGKSDTFEFEDDYYHSGDLIEWIDKKEGLFKFKSRKNELINIGGYKVNPSEVESMLLNIDGVQQVLVYGKKNSVLGYVLCADIVLAHNSHMTEIDIREYLQEHLQDFKIPRRIRFVDSMLLTRTGKLKRI